MSSALPAERYRDPFAVVAALEGGDLMPAERSRVVCQGCRFKRSSIDPRQPTRVIWPCWKNNMPGADGRCAKYKAA